MNKHSTSRGSSSRAGIAPSCSPSHARLPGDHAHQVTSGGTEPWFLSPGQGELLAVPSVLPVLGPAMAWREACSMLPNPEDFRVFSVFGKLLITLCPFSALSGCPCSALLHPATFLLFPPASSQFNVRKPTSPTSPLTCHVSPTTIKSLQWCPQPSPSLGSCILTLSEIPSLAHFLRSCLMDHQNRLWRGSVISSSGTGTKIFLFGDFQSLLLDS